MAIGIGEISGEPAIVVWPESDSETGVRFWTWRIVTTALLSQGSTKHKTPQHAFSEALGSLNQHIEEHNLALRKLS